MSKGSRRRPLVKCTEEELGHRWDQTFGKPVPGYPGWRFKDEGPVPDFPENSGDASWAEVERGYLEDLLRPSPIAELFDG